MYYCDVERGCPKADGDEPAGDWATSHDSVHDVLVNKKSIAMLVFILFSTEENQGSGLVLWTFTGRKTLPPSTSLPVMGEIAGVNTASLGGYLHSMKTRARWADGFHDEINGHVFDLERDGSVRLYFALESP